MNNKKKLITLEDLLQYLDCGERVQVVESLWDIYSEFPANSELLKPYYDYYVVQMGVISSDLIRVDLEKEPA